MWQIDGSKGEGGGQILRSSLALALLTGNSVRVANIRAGRARPGLMRQHLAAVRAAATITGGEVFGDAIGSTEVELRPGRVRGGDYTFSTGGAGSTTLVFQTLWLPLLLRTEGTTTVRFEGGTHNPMAPPFDFLARAFLPLLAKMGAGVNVTFDRHGFYPAGGGAWTLTLQGGARLGPLDLCERGDVLERSAEAVIAQVAPSVALRELEALTSALAWDPATATPRQLTRAHGPGNVLMATVRSEHVTEVFTGFGERGVRSEDVAATVATEVSRYLHANVPVGEHLADQLLMPMALGAGGSFRTVRPSLHCRTQIELLEQLLPARFTVTEERDDVVRIECTTKA